MIGNQMFHAIGVVLGLRPAANGLSDPEIALLDELSSRAPHIVEIGVLEGATSRRMLERMPPGGSLTLVDPFFAGRLGVAYGYWITWLQVRRSRRKDVRVKIERAFSHDLAPEFRQQVDLVFIDADHRYEAVQRDWRDWSGKVRIGGRIAFHDSQPVAGRSEYTGPVRLVRELGKEPPGFTLEQTSDSVSVYVRTA